MAKKYTAQEMREMATEAEVIEVADQFYGHDMDTIAAMLRQAADAMEREKLEKKYEYAARSNYDGFIDPEHCEESKLEHTFSCMKCDEYTVVRREVGEWEEVL